MEDTKEVKVAHTRLPSVGFRSWSRFLAVSLQVTWVINPGFVYTVENHDFVTTNYSSRQPGAGPESRQLWDFGSIATTLGWYRSEQFRRDISQWLAFSCSVYFFINSECPVDWIQLSSDAAYKDHLGCHSANDVAEVVRVSWLLFEWRCAECVL